MELNSPQPNMEAFIIKLLISSLIGRTILRNDWKPSIVLHEKTQRKKYCRNADEILHPVSESSFVSPITKHSCIIRKAAHRLISILGGNLRRSILKKESWKFAFISSRVHIYQCALHHPNYKLIKKMCWDYFNIITIVQV